MSTLAIDINDANLIIADESGVLAAEPGYALVADGEILTGYDAYAQARLRPRDCSNRFWENLSLEEGSAGLDGVDHTAQLAFAQLDDLWKRYGGEEKDALLVVPDHYSREQLGLLLGLAQECGMPVRSLVNTAVAASARPYPGQQLIYLDAGLHRVTATTLEQATDVAAKTEQAIDGVGLASLTDLWAKRVAEIFVLSTRFDPFHDADSEQLVYDRLPMWLQSLQEEDRAELKLPHGGKELCVEVKGDQLLGVAAGFYRALVQLIAQCRSSGDSLVVQVSHRLLGLPGVVNELSRLDDAHILPLAVGEAAQRIAPYAHRTPVLRSGTLDDLAGRRLFFKCENFQRVGAFKFRGACNAVMKLPDDQAARGVVTHSSGNHAQAIALACRLRGIEAHIVMPNTSMAVKREAVVEAVHRQLADVARVAGRLLVVEAKHHLTLAGVHGEFEGAEVHVVEVDH